MLAAKREGGALGAVKEHWIKQADAPSTRRMDVIHPSEMANDDWCPRQTYYRIRDVRDGKTIEQEQHSVGLLAIFEEGHYKHSKYQDILRKIGGLKGAWHCDECRSRYVHFGEAPSACPKCGSVTGVVYGEVPLSAVERYLIGGHSDGWWRDRLIEIKTIGEGTVRVSNPDLLKRHTHTTVSGKDLVDLNALWRDINRPFRPHLKQANIYLWLAAVRGIDVEGMEFIYEMKANQQTKSFFIKMSRQILDPLLDKANSIKSGLARGEPPPREFDNVNRNPCKNCPWLKECHAEDSQNSDGRSDTSRNVRTRGSRSRAESRPTRFDRAGRSRVDGAVQRDDGVGELPRDEAGGSSGGRKIRRIRAGNSASSSSSRKGNEKRDRSEG